MRRRPLVAIRSSPDHETSSQLKPMWRKPRNTSGEIVTLRKVQHALSRKNKGVFVFLLAHLLRRVRGNSLEQRRTKSEILLLCFVRRHAFRRPSHKLRSPDWQDRRAQY